MEHKNISLIDVLESFLTGISCLVGGDQLYLFVSQTNANPYNQYNYSLFVSAFTLTIAFILYDEYNEDFMNAVHLVYVTTLFFLVLILYSRIKSTSIVTLCNIFISIVLTTFVLSCCISYSIDRVLLLTFILGLFGSRLLPTLCWIFIDDLNPNIDIQLSNFALKLYLFRFIFCLLSIIRKVINNDFGLSILYGKNVPYDFGPFRRLGFEQLYESFKKWILTLPPLLSFCFSIVCINFIPIIPSSHLNYSSNINSFISINQILFHCVGFTIGIIYPASSTSNSLIFYITNFLLWVIYFIDSNVFSYYGDTICNFKIYIALITSTFTLGYICSYNLGVFVNITIFKTCKFEEYFKPCCGNKINKKCYCIFPNVVKDQNNSVFKEKLDSKFNLMINFHYYLSVEGRHFVNAFNSQNHKTEFGNMFCCSKSSKEFNSLEYSKDSTNAILILYVKDGENAANNVNDFKCCTKNCQETCQTRSCKCLKLLGIFKLDTITTRSCDMCQMTVRLEAKRVRTHNFICNSSIGVQCTCGTLNCKCCCLAVGCCNGSNSCQPNNCQCCKIRCCNGCTSCQCKNSTLSDTRIFFGYKNGDSECCIKEIKPADPQFEGSLGKQNDFYIGNIFLSDCCHVDLQVDLHCYMKNSFYRMTGVNYSMKSMKIAYISFMRDNGECCTTSTQSQCCCINAALVRLCLHYLPNNIKIEDDRKEFNKCELRLKCNRKCSNNCGCCPKGASTKCCCCNLFTVKKSIRSSFYKRMEPVKIKLSIIIIFLFMTCILISITIISENKNKKSKLYNLKQITSFDKVSKAAKKYKLNTLEKVNNRLKNNNTVSNEISETSETANNIISVNKSQDLKNMIKLFEEVLDGKSLNELNKYINKNSNQHIKKSKSNISKDDIIWSYCIGLMYSYVIEMYIKFQKFFIRWEFVWQKEYLNYTKLSNIEINRIINKSNYSFSLISELNLKEKIPYCITRERTKSFNNTYDELDRYINVNENELKNSQEIPNDIDERLKYFIDRWDPRIDTINHLLDIKSNMFEWDQMLNQYPFIHKWIYTFYPYLERAAKEVHLEPKKLNRGKFMFEYITSY